MNNGVVQLVQINRCRLLAIAEILKPVMTKMKTYIGRLNPVFFSKVNSEPVIDDWQSLGSIINAKFTLGVQAFSNIGEVINFNIDIPNGSCVPDDDEAVKKLSNNILVGTTLINNSTNDENETTDDIDETNNQESNTNVPDFTFER